MKMNFEHRAVNLEGSRSGARRRKISSSGSFDSEGSSGGSSSSSHRDKRKRHYKNSSHDQFKKERPPTFNGEVNFVRIINPPLSNLVICLNHDSCLNRESIQYIFSH